MTAAINSRDQSPALAGQTESAAELPVTMLVGKAEHASHVRDLAEVQRNMTLLTTRSAPGSTTGSPSISPMRQSLMYGFGDTSKSLEYLYRSRGRQPANPTQASNDSQSASTGHANGIAKVLASEFTSELTNGAVHPDSLPTSYVTADLVRSPSPKSIPAATEPATSVPMIRRVASKDDLDLEMEIQRARQEVADAVAAAESAEDALAVRDSSEPPPNTRPSLLRKKSGELVKSSLKLPPLVRTRSMPNTKNVHFDVNLEHVRRFNRKERPEAVSVGLDWASEDEDESDEEDDVWGMTTPSFLGANYDNVPGSERPDVYLENLYLAPDKQTLRGNILVRNISFNKHVAVRYTVDFWNNMSEIEAQFNSDIRKRDKNAGYDRFSFEIPFVSIANQRETNTLSMFLAVRYRVDRAEFWDNHNGLNYELLFRKGTDASKWPLAQRSHNSKKNGTSASAAGKQSLPNVGSFGTRSFGSYMFADSPLDDSALPDDFSNSGYDLTRTPSEIFASVAAETQSVKPKPIVQQKSNPLKWRYSFGAAYNNAPKANTTASHPFSPPSNNKPAGSAGKPPLPTERVFPKSNDSQPPKASSYQDLISKYCFFNPMTASGPTSGRRSANGSPPQRHASPEPSSDSSAELSPQASPSLSVKGSVDNVYVYDGSAEHPGQQDFPPISIR